MPTTPTPRPGILDIDPYVAGDSNAPGAARIIKLSSNECALGPSPKAVAAFRRAGDHLYRYPDSAMMGYTRKPCSLNSTSSPGPA